MILVYLFCTLNLLIFVFVGRPPTDNQLNEIHSDNNNKCVVSHVDSTINSIGKNHSNSNDLRQCNGDKENSLINKTFIKNSNIGHGNEKTSIKNKSNGSLIRSDITSINSDTEVRRKVIILYRIYNY